METAGLPRMKKSRRAAELVSLVFAFWVLVVWIPYSGWMQGFIQNGEKPWPFRLGVLLLPWAAFIYYLRLYWRLWQPDEWELNVCRRALGFACMVMLAGLAVIDQLQRAVLMPAFEWTNHRLILTMGALWLVGLGRAVIGSR